MSIPVTHRLWILVAAGALTLSSDGCVTPAVWDRWAVESPAQRGPAQLVSAGQALDGSYYLETRFQDGAVRRHVLSPVPEPDGAPSTLWPSPDDAPRLVRSITILPGRAGAEALQPWPAPDAPAASVTLARGGGIYLRDLSGGLLLEAHYHPEGASPAAPRRSTAEGVVAAALFTPVALAMDAFLLATAPISGPLYLLLDEEPAPGGEPGEPAPDVEDLEAAPPLGPPARPRVT